MPRVLITGGLGFIGSYAIEKFSQEGWDISVLDNKSTNAVDWDFLSRKNVSHMISENCLDYRWSNNYKFDLILHLASPVGPAGVLKWAGTMANEIIADTYWAIDGAFKNGCPLVFMSTSEVYGYRPEAVKLSEDDDKLMRGNYSVRNEYSMAKLLAEVILSNTAKVKPLQYHIIRPFNVSGARQQPEGGFVLPRFVKQALKNEDITVFGDGSQLRSFTHAQDIVDGIYKIVNSNYPNEIWNIGTDKNCVSIFDLATRVVFKTHGEYSKIKMVDPKTIYGPLYEEAWDKVADSTKIQQKLGWQHKYTTDNIIDDVLYYWINKKI